MLRTEHVTLAIALAMAACSKEEAAPPAPASSSVPEAAPSAAPSASASAAPSAAPSASSEPAEPHHDCPAKSSGVGSFDKPCDATGAVRMMTVRWTKTDDKGPSFSIKNIGSATILFGKIAVYFYDKSGKQLDAASSDPAATGDAGKGRPFHSCGGNMFQGVMKPGEKAVITFSCVAKANVPAGATAIEAEMQWVGFSDASEKKVDVYWRNPDLTPDVRKKGGVK